MLLQLASCCHDAVNAFKGARRGQPRFCSADGKEKGAQLKSETLFRSRKALLPDTPVLGMFLSERQVEPLASGLRFVQVWRLAHLRRRPR